MLAMAIIMVIHLIGAGVLIWWAMLGDERDDWRGPRDDDGGGGGGPTVRPPRPGPGPGGLPLPDAVQSPARLREAGRIGDWRPHGRPAPAHRPGRIPAPR
jgi:hypothetical protein